jgi:hypothetical protein
MLYGILLQLLVFGLTVHYLFDSESGARSKWIVGGLIGVTVLFASWLPVLLSLSIQILVSGYILILYRLREAP